MLIEQVEKLEKGGKSASRVGKKSKNANRVDSFIWHLRVSINLSNSFLTPLRHKQSSQYWSQSETSCGGQQAPPS